VQPSGDLAAGSLDPSIRDELMPRPRVSRPHR
jgi:hypothetical protein